MELSELRVFLTVASERSFSKAAMKLHRTQPAISQAVRRLELERLESLLLSELTEEFFSSVSSLMVFSPSGLPIDAEFASGDEGLLRDLLRQAAFILIDEQLRATPLTFGAIESIGAVARLISSQA